MKKEFRIQKSEFRIFGLRGCCELCVRPEILNSEFWILRSSGVL